ncbi:hypothetical protein RHAL1_01652 [Beijerinckiaceae bacterium RH AL1]|nr:hypothetical protein [Beijerinckiaceae bacterium]VVB45212.1 hypothetical protein RHCH11_RHCH11_01615 [Beijerinckiaceae bacterium RH CH11]VVB45290.1 hypothetical protein RHAL8_01611 [Beijerinckiaceae bacterium RH AL8]VVC54752.1 hypothetical protein RHAL1_01652 [Beijerinckiaceae bacterium RH AL1]
MTRYYESDLAIARLAEAVLDCSLPKAQWTHAAHFATALWLMRHRPDWVLPQRMPAIIRAYNEATDTPNTDTSGYHETITQASLVAARAFLEAAEPGTPLHLLVDRLMASRLGDPQWLLAHWSRERLFSVAARRAWVEPDLAPLGAIPRA